MKNFTHQKGFTVVEMLIYAAGLVLVVGLIVSILFYSYSWYGSMVALSRADQTAVTISERLAMDIKNGISVNDAQSAFATSSGALTLTVRATPTTDIIKYYALQNNRIVYRENGGQIQYITPVDVSITRFTLNQLPTINSVALRYSFDITYAQRAGTTTTTYSGLSIMRNSYE